MSETAALGGGPVAGRYRLVRPLGAGGMGQVWFAHDVMLDRTVAVKRILTPSEQSDEQRAERVQRAFREARNAARVSNHPNIVTVYDVVEQDGLPWIVMEYVPCRSLAERIAEHGALPAGDVARIGRSLLDALVAVHGASIVHRDIKPANVLLSDTGQVLLTDFGIAVAETDMTMTSTGAVIATPEYMAPERADGQPASPASDMFSLGATLYEAAEGISPFRRETPFAMLKALVFEEPRELVRAGPLGPLVFGLLAKDPRLRPTATQARNMFESFEKASAAAVTAPVPVSLPTKAADVSAVVGKAEGEGRPGKLGQAAKLRRQNTAATETAPHGALGATEQSLRTLPPADAPVRSARFGRALALWLLIQTALFATVFSLVHLRFLGEAFHHHRNSAGPEHVVLVAALAVIVVAIVTALSPVRRSHRVGPALVAAGSALVIDILWAVLIIHNVRPWNDAYTGADVEPGWTALLILEAVLVFALAAAMALGRERVPEWFVLGGAFALQGAAVVLLTMAHVSLTDDNVYDAPIAFHILAGAATVGLAAAAVAVWIAVRRAGAALRLRPVLAVAGVALAVDLVWILRMPSAEHYEHWSSERMWRIPLIAASLLLFALVAGVGRLRAARRP